MPSSTVRFVHDADALDPHLRALKLQCCPYCGAAETLNRHSKLFGNDPATADGQTLRGQRVFCCDRGQRGGCGRTFSIYLAEVLPRHTVTAPLLCQLLRQLLAGASIKASAQTLRLPFALETLYHLLGRLRQRLTEVRGLLCRRHPPPASSLSDPLWQTLQHLRCAFPNARCPVAEFQLQFQRPLLG